MNVKEGDILAGSWGYSMTLWSFVRVVRTTPKQVVLQELEKNELGGEMWRMKVTAGGNFDNRGRTFRVKNNKPDYIWNPTYRCLYHPFDENKEYFENHMD